MDNKKTIILGCSLVGIIIMIILFFCFDNSGFKNSNKDDLDIYDIALIEENENNDEKIENKISKIKVHITGEVLKQGLIELDEGSRIADAINEAGNITEFADLSKVNLAYELSDGQKVYIPSIKDETEEYISESAGESVLEDEDVKDGKININTADIDLLQTINGVGESLASKIIDYRKQNGKFKSIEDLKNVSGIGDKKFEDIKDKVIVK